MLSSSLCLCLGLLLEASLKQLRRVQRRGEEEIEVLRSALRLRFRFGLPAAQHGWVELPQYLKGSVVENIVARMTTM
jgi:hypothetical protein